MIKITSAAQYSSNGPTIFTKLILCVSVGGWVGGWMDGWMDGWVDEDTFKVYLYNSSLFSTRKMKSECPKPRGYEKGNNRVVAD
jgi:hypothetical protein